MFASDVEAVQAAIAVVRDHDRQLFVRGGGHNRAGTAVGDGLVLDVSGLRTLERDADAATIRVGAGLRWGELRALKRVYDPDNFFRGNQNVVPAERSPSEPDTPRGTAA